MTPELEPYLGFANPFLAQIRKAIKGFIKARIEDIQDAITDAVYKILLDMQ